MGTLSAQGVLLYLKLYQTSSLFFLIITPAAAAAVITANDDNAIPRFALPVLGILDDVLFSPPESLVSAVFSISSVGFSVVSAGTVSVTGAGSFSLCGVIYERIILDFIVA